MTAHERRVLDWTEVDAAMNRARDIRAQTFHEAFNVAWRWLKGEPAAIEVGGRPCSAC